MAAIIDDVRSWREALCAEGFEARLLVEIPRTLEDAWQRGVPIAGDVPLQTRADRRRALLDWWATRTCTPEGARVRELVARYLDREVQSSPWPVTADELAAANAQRACRDALALAGIDEPRSEPAPAAPGSEPRGTAPAGRDRWGWEI